MSRFLPCLGLLVTLFSLVGCGSDTGGGDTGGEAGRGGEGGSGGQGGFGGEDVFGRCADFDELRQVYWGDTHIHTVLSFDANMQGTRTTQADAYAFARGEPITLQPYTEDGMETRTAQIDRPLDFVTLSDHAEFFGTIAICNDPDAMGYESRQCMDYRAGQAFDATIEEAGLPFVEINGATAAPPELARYPDLCGPDGVFCIDAGLDVWADVIEEAEAAYDRSPSCEFTTFPGYEWSGGPASRNLHRNVMFKNGTTAEYPYSYLDEPYVEDLWTRLKEECIDVENECDVLAIPHNTNLSDGIFFENQMANGQPFTPEYAELRFELEPVIELYQHKGNSECLPGESNDDFCGFEIIPYATLAQTNLNNVTPPNPKGFLRYAYGEGMKLQADLGINPFAYGISAATDTHISAPGLVAEDDFKGHGGAGQPNRFLPPPGGFPDIEYLSGGGLTGVWAEENAREAIFSAFRRREVFGTSGPRIVVRLFGGWEYPDGLCDAEDLVAQGYDGGVPMGGELGPRVGDGGPRFVVTAKQDPLGAPLQRIQVVKGWIEGGESQVEIFEVAGNPDNGASVDLDTCATEGSGASDLCTVWEDPSFDPSQRAYYYARVIENPTCRWTTWQCSTADYDCSEWDYDACVELMRAEGSKYPESSYLCDCCDPATGLNVDWCDAVDCNNLENLTDQEARCCLPRVETSIQERAWSSPIWYQPPG
jgi:hypothetical protein